jgi:hypothetical protein
MIKIIYGSNNNPQDKGLYPFSHNQLKNNAHTNVKNILNKKLIIPMKPLNKDKIANNIEIAK